MRPPSSPPDSRASTAACWIRGLPSSRPAVSGRSSRRRSSRTSRSSRSPRLLPAVRARQRTTTAYSSRLSSGAAPTVRPVLQLVLFHSSCSRGARQPLPSVCTGRGASRSTSWPSRRPLRSRGPVPVSFRRPRLACVRERRPFHRPQDPPLPSPNTPCAPDSDGTSGNFPTATIALLISPKGSAATILPRPVHDPPCQSFIPAGCRALSRPAPPRDTPAWRAAPGRRWSPPATNRSGPYRGGLSTR